MVNISAVKSEIKRLREPAYSVAPTLLDHVVGTMGHAVSELVRSYWFRSPFVQCFSAVLGVINERPLVGIEAFQQATIRWIRFYGCNLASWKQFQPEPINDRYVTSSISQPNRSG